MTEIQQPYEGNLDGALDALLNPTPMTREEFETKMLEDKDFFADYAWKYMGSSAGYSSGLLSWAWACYREEVQG